MNKRSMLPKGPTGNSFFQLIKFIRKPITVFEECKKIYGKTFTLRALGHPDAVVVSTPEDIKQVFASNSDQLHTGELTATFIRPIFGGGIRRCIGAAFAQYEMKIIIAQILLHAELELKENYVPEMIRKGAVFAPSHGLPVIVRKLLNN